MSRGCGDRSRQRRDAVRSAGVLQRARRPGHRSRCSARTPPATGRRRCPGRPIPVHLLQTDAAPGRANLVAGVRQRNRAVRVPRNRVQRLRRVVPETSETVRDRPMEMYERHVRRPGLRRIRRRRADQPFERY